jgi:hypothetical protein
MNLLFRDTDWDADIDRTKNRVLTGSTSLYTVCGPVYIAYCYKLMLLFIAYNFFHVFNQLNVCFLFWHALTWYKEGYAESIQPIICMLFSCWFSPGT